MDVPPSAHWRTFWIVSVVLLGSTAIAESPGAPLVIKLRSRQTVPSGIVTLGQLADLQANGPASASLRELDVLSVPAEGREVIVINRKQIELRLRLAGVDPAGIIWRGAEQVELTVAGTESAMPAASTAVPLLADRLIEQLQALLAERWQVPEQEIDVRILSPIDVWQVPAERHQRVEPTWGDDLLPGRRSLWVRVYATGQPVQTRLVQLEIRRLHKRCFARQALPAGTILSAEHLRQEQVWSTQPVADQPLEELIGRQLRQGVAAGQAVQPGQLLPLATAASPGVRMREIVSVTARCRTLEVTLQAAEALQNGNVGERILLRNPESKRVIAGTVIGPGQVEIDLTGSQPTSVTSRPAASVQIANPELPNRR